MRKGLILVLLVVAGSGLSAPTGSAAMGFDPFQLKLDLDGVVSPKKLPRHEYAPATANVSGKIRTSDGTHPSALREAVFEIDKDVKINAKGYPVCEAGDSGPRWPNLNHLLRVCGDTVLGKGHADFEIAFPEQNPIKVPSPLIVFNGGEKGGKVTLFIHTIITVPAPTAIVTTVTFTRKGSEIDAVAKTPVIAAGSGSVLDFNFKLGKTYTYKGKKTGYFEAKCPDDVFKVSFPELLFKNEAHTPGVAATTLLKGDLAVPCTPRD